jgi:hypothetical protein
MRESGRASSVKHIKVINAYRIVARTPVTGNLTGFHIILGINKLRQKGVV